MCHDTVSYYDTTLTSFFINYHVISDFCLCGMHNIRYDTPIVTSLTVSLKTNRAHIQGWTLILINEGAHVKVWSLQKWNLISAKRTTGMTN
jgi:hypothetical protein